MGSMGVIPLAGGSRTEPLDMKKPTREPTLVDWGFGAKPHTLLKTLGSNKAKWAKTTLQLCDCNSNCPLFLAKSRTPLHNTFHKFLVQMGS